MGATATIQNLDIVLRGNTTNLDASVDRAGAGLSKFRAKVNTQAAGINARLASIGSGVQGAVENALNSPLSAIGSLARTLGNAFLHPISTIKSLVASVQGIGDAILVALKTPFLSLANFIKTPFVLLARLVSGLAGLFAAPFRVISAGISGLASAWSVLYDGGLAVAGKLAGAFLAPLRLIGAGLSALASIAKPIIIGVTSTGLSLVRAGLSALYSIAKPIVMPLALAGLSLVKTALSLIAMPIKIGVNLALQGYALVKSALASLPRAGSFLVNIISTGLSLVRAGIAGLYSVIKPIVVNLALKGLELARNAVAGLYALAKPIVIGIALKGWELVKSAVALLFKVPALVVRLSLAGYELVKSAISALFKVPSLIIRVATSGLEMARAGISGLGALLRGIGSVASNGLSGLASGASSAMSSLSALGSVGGVASFAVGGVAIAGIAAVAAMAALAGGAIYLASRQSTVIASMHRTAQMLGMTTEAFSALASTAGMSAETFGSGLEHLERTLSEAAHGGGEAAASLARVGLSAQSLMTVDPNAQLDRIADAMRRVGSQADRIRLSVQLFGREAGTEFVTALGNGSAGLEAFRQRAERFGLTFTGEQAEIVKRANKVWGEFKLGLQGIGNQLAIAFAPIWEWVGAKLSDFFVSLVEWTKKVTPAIESVWSGISPILDDLVDGIKAFYSWYAGADTSGGIFSTIKDAIVGAVPFIREGYNVIKTLTEVTWPLIKAIIDTTLSTLRVLFFGWVDAIVVAFQKISDVLGIQGMTWEQFKDAALKALITLEFGIKNWERVATLTWDVLQLKMLQWAQALNPVLSAVEGFCNAVIDAFNTMNRGIASLFNGTINGIISRYNALADQLGLSRVNFSVNVDARQLDHVQLGFQNLGAQIAELRERIAQEYGEIGADLDAFIQMRLAELNRVAQNASNAVNRTNQQMQPPQVKDNKAAERGSAEAFAIIVGEKEDRQYQALNAILVELRAARQLDQQQLAELRNRINVTVARL